MIVSGLSATFFGGEIKYTKQVPSIDQFWANWLHEIGNAVRVVEMTFREVLGLEGKEEGGILPMQTPAAEAVLEEAVIA